MIISSGCLALEMLEGRTASLQLATIVSSRYWDMHIPLMSHLPDAFRCFVLTSTFIMHAATQFHSHTVVTLSAESVGGSTPGVRVTWSTTVPPECVAFVRVEFRTSSRGPVVATYNTTNTSQTEVVQSGLQCATNYYIRVVVSGELRTPGGMPYIQMLSPIHSDVKVLVGGNETVCMLFNQSNLMHGGYAIAQIYQSQLE